MLPCAMTWAIPLPIVPAPTTNTRSMTGDSAFAAVSFVFSVRCSPARVDRSALARLYVPGPRGMWRVADLAFLDRRRQSVLGFGSAVAAVHGVGDAVPLPIQHTVGRCLEQEGKYPFFLGSEAGEHLVRGMSKSAANSDAHSGECVHSQLRDDDLRPLWPPEPPLARSRMVPKGSSMSSTTTSNWSSGVLYQLTASRTADPLRFM